MYKYMYIGERNGGRHNGIVSIGSYVTIEGDNYNVYYNLTFCSKSDQFIKSISRKIIEGRFKKFKFVISVEGCNFINIKQNIIEKILCDYNSGDIEKNISMPHWSVGILCNELSSMSKNKFELKK